MRADDRLRKTIVFVGMGGQSSFTPYGTGFVSKTRVADASFQEVVTAKHVIDRIPSEAIALRVNTKNGPATVIQTERKQWLAHSDPSIDIAVGPTIMRPDQFDILHLDIMAHRLTPEIIDQQYIGVGDEVIFPGMFLQHLGETRNIPIVRTGTIAAMPEGKILTDTGYVAAYLIEARSISGHSGSPVFVQLPPSRILENGTIVDGRGKVNYLLGVVIGHVAVESVEDMVTLLRDEANTSEEDAKRAAEVIAPMNTGIGIVLPIDRVIEVIDQMTETRRQVVGRERKNSGFVADSAKSELPTKADNPSHKEDFNRLLSSVTTGKPRED